MLLVVLHLHFPAALGLVDRLAHGIRHVVGVHDHMSVRVSRRAPDGLHQRSLGPQEPFLIRIQYRHQRDLRDIQALSEQVDAHQHVENVQSHVPDDLGALQRIDIRVQVLDADARARQIVRQILRHLLGQSSDEHLVPILHSLPDLPDQVVDLPVHRPHVDLGIKQSCRPDDLLGPHQLVRLLIGARRRAHEHHLVYVTLELLKVERSVVQS